MQHLLAEGRGVSRDRYNLKFQYYHARNKSYLFFRNRGLGPATLGFLIRDTWVHLYAYSVRNVHTLALLAVSFAGKAVGAALTVRQLLSAGRGLDEAPDQTSQ